jgi:ribosomal protein S18 acetylase RimI-like enzyme
VIRRLGPGDEGVLAVLAADEADFDLEERSGPRAPVTGADAAAYLSDPGLVHWVAEEDGIVVGHLLAYLERRRSGAPRQVLLYEIGVREAYRRRGIGRALVETMREWMRAEDVADAACGFVRDDVQPVQMTLTIPD